MKKIQISKQTLILIIALIVVASSIASGGVIAKYAQTRKDQTSHVTAKQFYFESDYLVENVIEGAQGFYHLNSTVESVSFNLYNFQREMCADPDCENCAFTSQVNCNYTVNVTSDDADFTLSAEQFSAPANTKTTQTVTLSDLKPGYSYQVSVTANGGYTKTLYATFSVDKESDGFFMNVAETETYILLTVWTKGNVVADPETGVTVTFPAGLIPDSTDPILAAVKNYEGNTYVGKSFTDKNSFQSASSSRSYRFFKTDGYTAGSFTVKMGDASAEVSDIP